MQRIPGTNRRRVAAIAAVVVGAGACVSACAPERLALTEESGPRGGAGTASRSRAAADAPGAAALAAGASIAPSITVGTDRVCALRPDASAACWQVAGTGEPEVRQPLAGSYSRLDASALGAYRVCAVRIEERLECWRGPGPKDLDKWPGLSRHVSVDVGLDRTCAVTTLGAVECADHTFLGFGPTATSRTHPESPYTSVAVGRAHACATVSDGSLDCWGTAGPESSPPGTRVSPRQIVRYLQVSSGDGYSCAVRDDGLVACWGVAGAQAPTTRTAAAGAYTQVSAAEKHTCALRTDGVVECWGDDTGGRARAQSVASVGRYVQVSAGKSFTCALRDDGFAECWGVRFPWSTLPVLDVRAPQSIGAPSVTPNPDGRSFAVAATTSSGLPAAFGSLTPARCTVVGATISASDAAATASNPAECVVTVDQAGDARWRPAGRVTVPFTPVRITLGGLGQPYDGTPRAVTATAVPGTVAPTVTYDGLPTPPSAPGRYAVVASIATAGLVGGAAGTLVIEAPRIAVQPARVSLTATSQVAVYVYGSDIVDAAAITPASVRLRVEGGSAAGAPVAARGGVPMTAVRDFDGDGKPDRQLVFLRADLQAAGLAAGARRLILEDHTGAYRFEARAPTDVEVVP